MACPFGCVHTPGHSGFHTTNPDIAKREDRFSGPPVLGVWYPDNSHLKAIAKDIYAMPPPFDWSAYYWLYPVETRPSRLLGPAVEHHR